MPKRRWENNIRMDLIEIGIYTKHWVDSAQVREVMELITEEDVHNEELYTVHLI